MSVIPESDSVDVFPSLQSFLFFSLSNVWPIVSLNSPWKTQNGWCRLLNPASSDVTTRFSITPGQKSVIMFLDLRASFLLRALYQIGTFSFTAAQPVQFSHVSLSPWPSQHLPVRPPTTDRIMPRLRQMKCSCQAPYLNIWSNCSPLHVPPLTHLLSHEEIKLPVTTFKEFLSSPPTTCHPCRVSSPPTSSHLQQHCCP